MNNYDGLFILNIQGKDEGLKESIEVIDSPITGAEGNREFLLHALLPQPPAPVR